MTQVRKKKGPAKQWKSAEKKNVRVSVWKNHGHDGVYYTISPEVTFFDESKEDPTNPHAAWVNKMDTPGKHLYESEARELAKGLEECCAWVVQDQHADLQAVAQTPAAGATALVNEAAQTVSFNDDEIPF